MKNRIYTFLMLFGLAVSSCNKSADPAATYLKGTATLTSPLTPNQPAAPMASQKITLKNMATGSSYDLLTDALGVFYFPGIPKTGSYQLMLTQTVTDPNQFQAVYSAAPTVTGGQPDISTLSLAVTLDTKTYKGLLITVNDTGGGAVPGAKVVVYSSGELAKLDPDLAGYGAVCSLTTNGGGLCLAMQLPQTVYLKALFTSTDGKVKLKSALQTVTVDSYKPVSITIQ